jgi:hypothetical protein
LGEAAEKLQGAAGRVKDPVAAFLLRLAAGNLDAQKDNITKFVTGAMEDLLRGKRLDPAKVRKLPLHERGPLLAAAAIREVDRRKQADLLLTELGAALAAILKGVLKA